PDRHIVGVQDGKLALSLAASLVRPGEVVEVRTPNAIVGIRGSFVVVETRLVSGVRQTDVTAVHVSTPVIVSSPIDPKLSVAITSGQTVSVRGLGATIVMAPARAITPEETTAATRAGEVPLSASRPIAPTVDQTRALATGQLEQAVALADSLLRVTGGVTGQVTGSAGATVRATGGVGGVTGSALPGATTTTQTAGGAVASTLSGTISGTTSTLTNAISAIIPPRSGPTKPIASRTRSQASVNSVPGTGLKSTRPPSRTIWTSTAWRARTCPRSSPKKRWVDTA